MKTRTATTTVLTSAALAAALGLTGCTSGDGGDPGDAGGSASPTATSGETSTAMSPGSSGTSPGAGEGASGPSTSTATATQDNRADHMFARMMIPHHQQAIEMSDIILGKEGLDPEIEVRNGQYPDTVALAKTIIETQQREIETMRELLGR